MYPRWVDNHDLLSYPPRHYSLLHPDDVKLIIPSNYIYQLIDVPYGFTIQSIEQETIVAYSSSATFKDPNPQHPYIRYKYYPLFLDRTDLQFSKLPSLEERMSRGILPTILARVKFSNLYHGIPSLNLKYYIEYYGSRAGSQSMPNQYAVWEILDTVIKC